MSERMNEGIYKKYKLCTFKNGAGESVLKVVKRQGQKRSWKKNTPTFYKNFTITGDVYVNSLGQGAPLEKRHENLGPYQKIVITTSHPPNPQVW